MDSSNASEDGASERVRFDNTIYFAMDKEPMEKVNKLYIYSSFSTRFDKSFFFSFLLSIVNRM